METFICVSAAIKTLLSMAGVSLNDFACVSATIETLLNGRGIFEWPTCVSATIETLLNGRSIFEWLRMCFCHYWDSPQWQEYLWMTSHVFLPLLRLSSMAGVSLNDFACVSAAIETLLNGRSIFEWLRMCFCHYWDSPQWQEYLWMTSSIKYPLNTLVNCSLLSI